MVRLFLIKYHERKYFLPGLPTGFRLVALSSTITLSIALWTYEAVLGLTDCGSQPFVP